MHFEWTFSNPPEVTPEQIIAIWATRDFYVALAAELDVTAHDVDIDYEAGSHLTTEQRMIVSLDDVPSIYRRIAGAAENLNVRWTTRLHKEGDGAVAGKWKQSPTTGGCRSRQRLRFPSAPA